MFNVKNKSKRSVTLTVKGGTVDAPKRVSIRGGESAEDLDLVNRNAPHIVAMERSGEIEITGDATRRHRVARHEPPVSG